MDPEVWALELISMGVFRSANTGVQLSVQQTCSYNFNKLMWYLFMAMQFIGFQ